MFLFLTGIEQNIIFVVHAHQLVVLLLIKYLFAFKYSDKLLMTVQRTCFLTCNNGDVWEHCVFARHLPTLSK